LRARLAALGVRGWRLNASDLAGCPDFVFDARHVAVFLDGCFWHGCRRCQRVPSSNQEYWVAKVRRNRRRDRRTAAALREQGWTVLRIWEHELRLAPRRVVSRIVAALGV